MRQNQIERASSIPDFSHQIDPNEIRKFLVCVLRSKEFYQSRQRKEFLTFLVESALTNRLITEKDIAVNVFGISGYQPEDTRVRTVANHVRSRLHKYYGEEGRDDAVRIIVLPGKGYRVEFVSVCPASEFELLLREGNELMRDCRPASLDAACKKFVAAVDLDPAAKAPRIAYLETRILQLFHDHLSEPYDDLRELLRDCEFGVARHLLDEWHPLALRATFRYLAGNWEKADKDFSKAINIDRKATEAYPGYIGFLFAVGRGVEATAHTEALAHQAPLDVFAQTLHALSLYLRRDFMGARTLLTHALSLPGPHWLTHLVMSFVCIETGEPDLAETNALMLGDTNWMGLLACCRRVHLNMKVGKDRDTDTAHYLELLDYHELARKDGRNFQKSQILFGLTPSSSILHNEVQAAYNAEEPIMLWFHMLPVFERIHKVEEVKRVMYFYAPKPLSKAKKNTI
jgi:hypothetical protein